MAKYAKDLITQKNDFQVAMVMQIAVSVDKIGMWHTSYNLPVFTLLTVGLQESMTSDVFLQMRLDPAKQEPLEGDCLEDTRVHILQEVRDWLDDSKSANNILWIVGAPGAGKSTIATTIARELANKSRHSAGAPSFAKFFSKRDKSDLRDPGQIWRTLAYSLAVYSQSVNHNGLKAAIMLALSEKNGHPRDDSVIDQFQTMIKEPLETAFTETMFLLHKAHFPHAVIIIDALDECHSVNGNSWQSLLKSLTCWSKLAGVFKLVVTSRDLPDIRKALGEVSHHIDLTTGDDVSEDSKRDVGVFFTKKFGEIREDFGSLSDWPREEVIKVMMDFAAGLFIWADMVIKFVGHHAVGCNPVKRLEDVISDIKPDALNNINAPKELDGRNQVDRLYARIVFEGFRHSTPGEREMAKRILATIMLVKEPLRICDLVEVLSTETSNSSEDILASIKSTLKALSPIIPLTDHANDKLLVRVCHKNSLGLFLIP